jgi:hypothetical protein
LWLTTCLFADTSVLIDFDKLKANGDGVDATKSLAQDDAKMKDVKDHDAKARTQHMPTIIDYSAVAGSSFNDKERSAMRISLASYNWDVELNSSASSIENRRFSKAIEWHTKSVNALTYDLSGDKAKTDGFTILGARIHFPETPFNCWALIKPPFEIPAFEDIVTDFKGAAITDQKLLTDGKQKKFENGYGVIKNVGAIKNIKMRVFGCQFKNSIAVLIKDDNSVTTEYPMNYLDFDGWKEQVWNNPNYIDNAANRNLYVLPLYPHGMPYIKLIGFRIYRQGEQFGGDFVVYIKDVKVTYDKAVLESQEIIDHESAWGILQARTEEAKKREYSRIGQNQILRFLEKQKMDKSAP